MVGPLGPSAVDSTAPDSDGEEVVAAAPAFVFSAAVPFCVAAAVDPVAAAADDDDAEFSDAVISISLSQQYALSVPRGKEKIAVRRGSS